MSIKVRAGRDTFLVSGVPRKRGTPVHRNSDGFFGQAETNYDEDGKVISMVTPRGNPLVRIHELMHARHSDVKANRRYYAGLPMPAQNLMEDVRIHMHHWPWPRGSTPKPIKEAILEYIRREQSFLTERLDGGDLERGNFADFATRLRMVAVLYGASSWDIEINELVDEAGFVDAQKRLARQMLNRMGSDVRKRHRDATKLMISAFFPEPDPSWGGTGWGGGTGVNPNPDPDVKMIAFDGYQQPDMDIIELPLTEHVEGADVGERRATMGSRMYRPALRRPVLPQRMFIRRTPREPGGTILIDASGSMGDMENIKRWLKRAPFGQIAYYAGDGHRGWLWVYAKDGRRAAEVVEPDSRGNTVDGPALTWLMQQPSPRVFVTDRGFCDAEDSGAQQARLAQLEGAGEVIVKNYNNADDYEDDPNADDD